jgi:hypothetical protein
MSPGAALAHRISIALMGVFVLVATGDGFAQSYAGLYHWALQHGLHGWKAQSFPLMVDLFIAVGELGLFALALEGHQLTRRGMSWADLALPASIATAGWTVSLVFNVGAVDGFAVKATHAVPPIASMLGLLVLLRTLHRLVGRTAPRTAGRAAVPHALLKQTIVARYARTPAHPRHVICAGPAGVVPLRAPVPHAARTPVEPARPAIPHNPRTLPPHAGEPAHPHAEPSTARADRTEPAHGEAARQERTRTAPAHGARADRTPPRTTRPHTPATAAHGNVTPLGGAPARAEWAKSIAEEILTAENAGRTWEPNYDDLTHRSGFKRRWCEARVSEARDLAARMRERNTPARADRTDDEDEPARDWAPLRTEARTADAG